MHGYAGDREALLSLQRPIVILRRRPEAALPAEIAPGNNTLGVMLPYTPLHYLIFGESPGAPEFPALVMTSGNLNEEPIVIQNEEAWQRLSAIADWLLFHNRDIYMRVDDSVVRSIAGQSRVGRRSRGYAPFTVDLKRPMHPILGSGAELKNTFCLTKDRYAILSQHIGDLENYETLRFFEESLHNLKKLFRVEPATGCLRPSSAIYEYPIRTADRAEVGRSAAPSCSRRQLHGGERSLRSRNRRGTRRDRLRNRWPNLGG